VNYRREIDGLRAVAVLSVIAYHAGFSYVSGGFVGVDIFFVISGYLITTLILTEQSQGRFSLLKFYDRRARRILPALFVMLLTCLPFAWAWMLPKALDDFSQTLAGVATFSSNFVLWHNSGYFNAENELKPLLHTWSLAVEEQYYWLFPIFVLAASRLGKRTIAGILILVAISSLGLAEWGSTHYPTSTFFLLPSRAWELLVGALLAHALIRGPEQSARAPLPRWALELIGAAGLAALLISVVLFDKYTPFPSLYALLPTLGTACVIGAASARTLAGRLLGSKPFVGIGLVSYSAYLWHQPLFAFARIHQMSELSPAANGALCVLSLLLAVVSWKCIETPFRARHFMTSRNAAVLWITGSLAFLGVGLYGHSRNGFQDRLTATEQAVYAFNHYRQTQPYREGTCFLRQEQSYDDFKARCEGSATPDILIWGDSHAAAFSSGLRIARPALAQFTASACPPLLGIEFGQRPQCRAINDFILAQIKRLQPASVYLTADWLSYRPLEATRAIGGTIDEIHRVAPQAHILVIGGVPKWTPTLPDTLLAHHLTLASHDRLVTPFYEALKSADAELLATALAHHAAFASALEALCDSSGCQLITDYAGTRQLITWDNGHLTEAGAALLNAELSPRLQKNP
jgi:peptidoglycan/LPS O-acetylase OafA/YrhL